MYNLLLKKGLSQNFHIFYYFSTLGYFPPYHLRTRDESGQHQVWDPIRKKWIVLTPEEEVRQLLIQFLLSEKSVAPGLIGVEKEIPYFKLRKRFDVVVFDSSGNPLVLCECKSPDVALSQEVLFQIARYNATIQAPHLLITNGEGLLFFSKDPSGKYRFQEKGWFG